MVAYTSFIFSLLYLCGWLSSDGEPISTKSTIAYNQKQQENNRGVLLSVTEEISYKENRLGF